LVGGHDTVYEATPLEPELPWWKQRRTKVFMVINFVLVLIAALAVGLSVSPRSSPPPDPAAGNTTSIAATTPIATTGASSRCFADRNELNAAVDRYVKDNCGAVSTPLCSDFSDMYGWPMGSWCVINVTDMSSLFKGLDTFNEDISMWNVSQVTDMSYMLAEAGTFNRDISSWNVWSVTDMSYMFTNATSFNQNLCAWQDIFPYSSASDIFVDSGCAYKGTPSSAYQGPFCASSCNTVSPTD
jgi:surface protein